MKTFDKYCIICSQFTFKRFPFFFPDSPVCKSGQETSFSAVVNKPIHIGCEVESDPDDVTFKWEFNGTSPGGNQQVSPVKGSDVKSILNYTPLTELDFGAFYCWGKNSVGVQKEPCVFVINPAGR